MNSERVNRPGVKWEMRLRNGSEAQRLIVMCTTIDKRMRTRTGWTTSTSKPLHGNHTPQQQQVMRLTTQHLHTARDHTRAAHTACDDAPRSPSSDHTDLKTNVNSQSWQQSRQLPELTIITPAPRADNDWHESPNDCVAPVQVYLLYSTNCEKAAMASVAAQRWNGERLTLIDGREQKRERKIWNHLLTVANHAMHIQVIASRQTEKRWCNCWSTKPEKKERRKEREMVIDL